jgi:probable phosphoglycerate mutase
MTRTRAWLEGIERDCVVVSHGGVSRTLRGHVLDLDVATVPLLDMPQDRVLILRRGTSEWI